MVILLGGAGGTGKTFLADRLMRRLAVPCLSLDSLMMGLCRSDPACGFTPESDVKVIGARLWPMVREMIKTNIENSRGMIFEGVQLLPGLVSGLIPEYADQITARWLCFSDGYIEARYDKIASMHNAVEKRADKLDDRAMMVRKNRELIGECEKFSVKYFKIDSDYATAIDQIKKEIASAFANSMSP